MRLNTLSTSLLFAVVGCADTEPAKTALIDQEVTGDNGVSLNGVSLNGVSINGVSLNGVSLNGVSLNGVSLNGVSLNGTDFIGATMTSTFSNGTTAELRIDDAGWITNELLTYEVSVATDGGWTSICGYEADGSARRVFALPGTWDTTTGEWSDDGSFTFACRGSSIAKCLELGYTTWDGFSDHHHACVRMLRADYCGDGVSHTTNGTPINLYDNAGVQADTEAWRIDAEWNADGAICFNHHRGDALPSCSGKYSASCGSFAGGALLINERE